MTKEGVPNHKRLYRKLHHYKVERQTLRNIEIDRQVLATTPKLIYSACLQSAKRRNKMDKQREIKFRAWDEKNKRMFDVKSLSLWTKEELGLESERDNIQDGSGNWFGSCILMQYTGLLDKNGKEIYEGDILQPTCYLKSSVMRRKVEFKNGAFTIGGINAFEMLKKAECASNQFEIIGNIYEKPELIKSEEVLF